MASYIVNVDDPTTPTNQQGAEQGAEELRALKSKLQLLQGQAAFWNPNDKASDITLTNGYLGALKAANNGVASAVRGTFGKSSGKWFWEITVTTITGSINIGIGLLTATLAGALGSDALGWAYRSDGNKFNNNTATGYGATFTTNDVIGIAWDADANSITFYKNGASQGVAFNTGLTGTLFPMVSLANVNDTILANFGLSAFAFAVPAGFSPLATDVILSNTKVARRQTVLTGPRDSNGLSTMVEQGAGASINLKATAAAVILAFAAGFGAQGNQDYIEGISADVNSYWSGLPNNTNYLAITRDAPNALTAFTTLVPPQYSTVFDRTQNSLLHFDGNDASTTILDDFGNTWAVAGNAQLDTAQAKFGTSSLLLDGTGDYAQSTSFKSLGQDSWELSVWFRINALPGVGVNAAIIDVRSGPNPTTVVSTQIQLNNTAGTIKLSFYASSNGTAHDIANAVLGTNTVWALNQWNRVRIVFDALLQNYRVYLSLNAAAETQDISVASGLRVCACNDITLGIGTDLAAAPFNGWLDEFRLIRAASVTATETPKASAFTVNETGQLIHWFSIPEMKMYEITSASAAAGTNPGMTARTRIFVGEADVSGGAAGIPRSYAYNGRFVSASATVSGIGGTIQVKQHAIGVRPDIFYALLTCITSDLGYFPGEVVLPNDRSITNAPSNVGVTMNSVRNGVTMTVATSGVLVTRKDTFANAGINGPSWVYQIICDRGW